MKYCGICHAELEFKDAEICSCKGFQQYPEDAESEIERWLTTVLEPLNYHWLTQTVYCRQCFQDYRRYKYDECADCC